MSNRLQKISRATEDEKALEELIVNFYSAFDNRQGLKNNVMTVKNLFTNDARITKITDTCIEAWSIEDFITPRILLLSNGTLTEFHEWETGSELRIIGNMASRTSTYQKEGVRYGSHYGGRGIKMIHFCRCGVAWKINAILWEDSV